MVLFTGPCDEAARNTECEVLQSLAFDHLLHFFLKPFPHFKLLLFSKNTDFQEIIEELETIDDEVDSYGMALVTTEVKYHKSANKTPMSWI